MYTQCSSCATLFRVTPQHLREAQGRVRCCLCHETFDALSSLTDRLPPDLASEEMLSTRRGLVADPGVAQRTQAAAEAPAPLVAAEAGEDGDEDEPPVRAPGKAPVNHGERDLFVDLDFPTVGVPEPEEPPLPTSRSGWSFWGWTLGVLLLVVLLVAQYGYLMREDLAQYPRLRPWLETLCVVAKCELPLLKDVSQINILQRRIGAHPRVPNALLVKATLVNDATFPQPYPQLRLSFLDANGRVGASRWFTPQEYLEDDQRRAQLMEGMPPKQPVAVRLDIADPGEEAAQNFEIDFR